jgi:predicted ArsR family transcriptional regulator
VISLERLKDIIDCCHAKNAHAAVDALVEWGVIVEVERRSNGAGRPTKAYKLAEG